MIVFVLTIALCLLFGPVACGATPSSTNGSSDAREKTAVERIYEAAQGLGYQGSLEEFLEACKGADGVSITGAFIDDEDDLVLTKSDGTSIHLGKIKGKDGKDGENGKNGENGQNGVGVRDVVVSVDGELIVTLTDGTVKNCGKVVGDDGLIDLIIIQL